MQVSVNGEAWGLFLAIEEPEDAFAERIWGEGHGMLYKPDYRSLDDENADVALRYVNDDPASYPGIFESARFDATAVDEKRLVDALKALATGKRDEIERSVDVDEVLRDFAVQTFVANLDSYLGSTGHNYFLYEEDGRLAMLPWDYNLAFGTYALGRAELPDDAGTYVNLPIDTPAAPEVLAERPLFTNLMAHGDYRERYHGYLDELVQDYVESGRLQTTVRRAEELIAPYVAEDPTAFISFEEFQLGVDTLEAFCLLRAQRAFRRRLQRPYPEHPRRASRRRYVADASSIHIEDMGELSDLSESKRDGVVLHARKTTPSPNGHMAPTWPQHDPPGYISNRICRCRPGEAACDVRSWSGSAPSPTTRQTRSPKRRTR